MDVDRVGAACLVAEHQARLAVSVRRAFDADDLATEKCSPWLTARIPLGAALSVLATSNLDGSLTWAGARCGHACPATARIAGFSTALAAMRPPWLASNATPVARQIDHGQPRQVIRIEPVWSRLLFECPERLATLGIYQVHQPDSAAA